MTTNATDYFENTLGFIPVLDYGDHTDPSTGMCVMEMVSYVAGEDQFSDTPACSLDFISKVAQNVNDGLTTNHRKWLIDEIPRLVGTSAILADPKKLEEFFKAIEAISAKWIEALLAEDLIPEDAKVTTFAAQMRNYLEAIKGDEDLAFLLSWSPSWQTFPDDITGVYLIKHIYYLFELSDEQRLQILKDILDAYDTVMERTEYVSMDALRVIPLKDLESVKPSFFSHS